MDAQLPPGLVRHLAAVGHQAQHVNDIKQGVATDSEIWSHASRTQAVIITKDADFTTLARNNPAGPQVIWIRWGNVTNRALWTAIRPLLTEIEDALVTGERVIEVV